MSLRLLLPRLVHSFAEAFSFPSIIIYHLTRGGVCHLIWVLLLKYNKKNVKIVVITSCHAVCGLKQYKNKNLRLLFLTY